MAALLQLHPLLVPESVILDVRHAQVAATLFRYLLPFSVSGPVHEGNGRDRFRNSRRIFVHLLHLPVGIREHLFLYLVPTE